MRLAHHPDQVRAAEAPLLASQPEGTLMGMAAAGLATWCRRVLGTTYGARVVLLVGSGDNGGDALHAGAALARRGARVDALLLGSRAHEAGLAAFLRAGGQVAAAPDVLATADLVVDGILGIGGSGGLRDAAAAAVAAIPDGVPVVAADLPSGVDAATGEVTGPAVRADVTVTFGTLKPGLLVAPGSTYAGVVELVDLGLGAALAAHGAPALEALQLADVADRWPWPAEAGDKYARGALGVHAGSARYPGAAVLCVSGALGAGCGYVRVAAVRGVSGPVRLAHPEAVVTGVEPHDPAAEVGRVQAWAVGSGLGTDDAAQRGVRALLDTDLPVVVDADGLAVLAADPKALHERAAPTLLTPHAGELARLLGVERADVEARALDHVRRAAETYAATVLLKGATTLVADPGDAAVRVNTVATPWLGTAGAGDVLTGVCGTLLAAGHDPREAGSLAAWVHGLAGRIAAAGGPLSAGTLAATLPQAVAALPH